MTTRSAARTARFRGCSIAAAFLAARIGFEVRAHAGEPCNAGLVHCQERNRASGRSSVRTADHRVAEDFRVAADGALSALCWWGFHPNDCYLSIPDDFEVRYYRDAQGVPGALLAGPFSQSGGTLLVFRELTGETILGEPEFRYTAAHNPVALTADQCYWVEITNHGGEPYGCNWFWEFAEYVNGRCCYDTNREYTPADRIAFDMAWCGNLPLADVNRCSPPPAPNDLCSNAAPIRCERAYRVNNAGATESPTDPAFPCAAGGAGAGRGTVWYWFTATAATAELQTCGSSAADTLLAVYAGDCSNLVLVACNDNSPVCGPPGGQARLCVDGLVVGATYLVEAASAGGESLGRIDLALTCACTAEPCAGQLRGDADGSGLVNNFDIDPFVVAIVDPAGYQAVHGTEAWLCRNDLNSDGLVNNFDIDAFVACIADAPPPGAGCP